MTLGEAYGIARNSTLAAICTYSHDYSYLYAQSKLTAYYHKVTACSRSEDEGVNLMLPIFTLTTERLLIRPFVASDLAAIHPILNECFGDADIEDRHDWLDWTVRNYHNLARLYQPPYGDRAIILRTSGELIGAVGFVPSFGPFDLLPSFAPQISKSANDQESQLSGQYRPEMGLFWAVAVRFRRQGFATEAARAMIQYAFTELKLARIVATTEHDNHASIAVMRQLDMTIDSNPLTEPSWFQVVGVKANADNTL